MPQYLTKTSTHLARLDTAADFAESPARRANSRGFTGPDAMAGQGGSGEEKVSAIFTGVIKLLRRMELRKQREAVRGCNLGAVTLFKIQLAMATYLV